jgi:hypothetical protein
MTGSSQMSREMLFLNRLLKMTASKSLAETRRILQHPLIHVFSDLKWNRLKFVYYIFLMSQTCLLICYTLFLLLIIYVDCPFQVRPDANSTMASRLSGGGVIFYVTGGSTLFSAIFVDNTFMFYTICESQMYYLLLGFQGKNYSKLSPQYNVILPCLQK